MEELGEGLKFPQRDGNPTRRPTVSTNLDPWELSETEPANKEHTQAWNEAPSTYVADMQLRLSLHSCLV